MHMRIPSTIVLALGVLALPACGSNPSSGPEWPTGPALELPLAVAERSCGPTDGPATLLRLSTAASEPPAPPVAFVSVWRTRSELAGHTFVLDGRQGGASLQRTAGGEYVPAADGRMSVERVRADGTIEGRVWVRFRDGLLVAQEFVAPWREALTICG
jgi:hypothetical protein